MKVIKNTIKELPENYSWDDIFSTGIGVPTGTQNMFKIYFEIPKLKSQSLSTETGQQGDNKIELKLFYFGALTEQQVASVTMDALRKADPDCNTLMSPLSQPQEGQDELWKELYSELDETATMIDPISFGLPFKKRKEIIEKLKQQFTIIKK